MATAAFFDVDNTLIRGSTSAYMARGLIGQGYFTKRQVADLLFRQVRFTITSNEHAGDMAVIIGEVQRLLAGRKVSDVARVGGQIFDDRVIGNLWPEAVQLVQDHLANGEQVWLVTSTGQEIADLVAERVGATGALGTRSAIEDGVYTGELVGPPLHGPAKAVAIRELAERLGLDLAASFAYSDSANDIPMLSAVGRAVAVNPDRKLRKHASDRGWQILDFRYPSLVGRSLAWARVKI
ncbi:MAG: HAD-IB family hydrolase [Actinomycetes bacterium]